MSGKISQTMSWFRSHPKTTVVLAFVALIASMGITSNPAPSSTPEERQISITSATDELVCERFHKLYQDISAGILTDTEMRAQAQGVYEKAKYASSRVNNASGELLSAITQGNTEKAKISYGLMINLCEDILAR